MNSAEIYPTFVYNTGPTALTPSGTLALTPLSIQSTMDFVVTMMTIVVTQASLVVTNFGGVLQIEDSSEKWFSLPISIASLIGSGLKPYGFAPYKRLGGNTTLLITVTNPVATATSVDVGFHGFRIPQNVPVPRHYLYALTPARAV